VSDPDFITLEDALRIHAHQIAQYGGKPGVRDLGRLSSAIGMAHASFDGEYLQPTLPEKAAAYLFHVAQNHPFLDANKRAALAIALVFLELNSVEIVAADAAVIDLVLRVATGAASKSEVAVVFEKHVG
jgi:death-on-curing protein